MADGLDKVRRQWEHLRIERERAENERRLRAELADLDDEQQHSVHMCHLGLRIRLGVAYVRSPPPKVHYTAGEPDPTLIKLVRTTAVDSGEGFGEVVG